MKKIEEEDKWKCLLCDPSFLREARALYWSIYKYHRDKPCFKPSKQFKGASTSTPNKLDTSLINGKKSKSSQKQSVNERVPSVVTNKHSHIPKPSFGSVKKAYSKLHKNCKIHCIPVNFKVTIMYLGSITVVAPVRQTLKKEVNGIRPIQNSPEIEVVHSVKAQPKHYVDKMIKEADDFVAQFVSMMTQV